MDREPPVGEHAVLQFDVVIDLGRRLLERVGVDPQTNVPLTEVRSPLAGDVFVPELGPIQLASITTINYTDLFSVASVSFEIDGNVVDAVADMRPPIADFHATLTVFFKPDLHRIQRAHQLPRFTGKIAHVFPNKKSNT